MDTYVILIVVMLSRMYSDISPQIAHFKYLLTVCWLRFPVKAGKKVRGVVGIFTDPPSKWSDSRLLSLKEEPGGRERTTPLYTLAKFKESSSSLKEIPGLLVPSESDLSLLL